MYYNIDKIHFFKLFDPYPVKRHQSVYGPLWFTSLSGAAFFQIGSLR